MNKLIRTIAQKINLYDSIIDLKYFLTGVEKKHIEFYSRFLTEGDLCFDIGANIGRRSKVFLKLKTKVIAVEPQPKCLKNLYEKFKDNSNVTIVPCAVGEKTGQAEMFLCDMHELSSLSKEWIDGIKDTRYPSFVWNTKALVDVVTLDKLIAEYGKPSFIKIDVEGYEYEVLKGLSIPINSIGFEFTSEFLETAFSCIKYINNLGDYYFNYAFSDDQSKFILPENSKADIIINALNSAKKPNVGDIYAFLSR